MEAEPSAPPGVFRLTLMLHRPDTVLNRSRFEIFAFHHTKKGRLCAKLFFLFFCRRAESQVRLWPNFSLAVGSARLSCRACTISCRTPRPGSKRIQRYRRDPVARRSENQHL